MKKLLIYISLIVLVSVNFSGCKENQKANTAERKALVVTYAVLASVVQELVGNAFTVQTLIPNGLDPHEWQPSALDLQSVTTSAVLVRNGLALEGGIDRIVKQAQSAGVKIFTVADHIIVRKMGPNEPIPSGDIESTAGTDDPHLWLDPLTIKTAIIALADYLKSESGVDLGKEAAALSVRLDELDKTIRQKVEVLPPESRKLVTGHESLGYFAARYGFEIVGAVVPSLSTQAEVSAADVAAIKQLIMDYKVKAIFTELGTPPKVVDALGRETGVKVIRLNTHVLPADNSYFTFMLNLTDTIVESLK